MADSLTLLDEAIALGKSEMESLAGGEDATDEAMVALEEAAARRARLVEQAWSLRDEAQLEALGAKLRELERLQGQLTGQARKLHGDIKARLMASRRESTRISGYAKTVKKAPVVSRFMSKQG